MEASVHKPLFEELCNKLFNKKHGLRCVMIKGHKSAYCSSLEFLRGKDDGIPNVNARS